MEVWENLEGLEMGCKMLMYLNVKTCILTCLLLIKLLIQLLSSFPFLQPLLQQQFLFLQVSCLHQEMLNLKLYIYVIFSCSRIYNTLSIIPGHIILAPDNTNLMAPLSTCCFGRKTGNLWYNFSVGIHWPSRWRKNNWSPALFTNNSMWSWLKRKIRFNCLPKNNVVCF